MLNINKVYLKKTHTHTHTPTNVAVDGEVHKKNSLENYNAQSGLSCLGFCCQG